MNSTRFTLILGLLFTYHASNAQVPDPTIEFPQVPKGSVTVPTHKGLFFYGTVNGHGPIEFLFDTGASSVVTSALAKRLGLRIGAATTLQAFGGSPMSANLALADTVRIGGLTLHNLTFVVLDAGPEEGAILGDQLLHQAVITLDWTHSSLSFSDPKVFHYAGTSSPARLHNQGWYIAADGAVDGLPGLFGIDTGARGSLAIYSPIVSKEGLIARYHATLKGYGGGGIAGPSQAFYTRAHELTLGSVVVQEPLTYLMTDTEGIGASADTGNIGRQILHQFTITFDLPHGNLYLDKNEFYGRPDNFNGAGLALDAGDDAVTVKSVLPRSSGAAAGIVVEDQILAVDHVSALAKQDPQSDDPVGLTEFLRPAGTVLHLRLRHGQSERDVSVTLQRVL